MSPSQAAPSSETSGASPSSPASADLAGWVAGGGPDGWEAALDLVEALPRAQRAARYLLPGYSYLYSRVPASISSVGGGMVVHAAHEEWCQSSLRTQPCGVSRIDATKSYAPFQCKTNLCAGLCVSTRIQ